MWGYCFFAMIGICAVYLDYAIMLLVTLFCTQATDFILFEFINGSIIALYCSANGRTEVTNPVIKFLIQMTRDRSGA